MKKIIISILLATAMLGLFSCDWNRNQLKYVVPEYASMDSGFSYESREAISAEEVPNEQRDFALEYDEDYDVTYEKVKATASYDDLCAMGVESDLLYPGAILDVKNDAYRSIYVDRAPLTISANLESMLDMQGVTLSATINDPNRSTVRDGIRDIVSKNVGKGSSSLPAKFSFEIKEIKSQDEFAMNLGFGLQQKKLDISENFSYDSIKQQTNLVIILKQEYYTVDVDYKGPGGFFNKFLTNADIEATLEGTIPAYVASVAYGRIAMITIQTNYSKDEITNALSVAWGKMSQNGGSSSLKKLSVDLDNTLQSISRDSGTQINYFVYGGGTESGSGLSKITPNSEDMICKIFESFDAEQSVGLPIMYKLRYLDSTLYKMQNADEYTVKKVTYNPKKIMDWSYLNKLLTDGVLQNSEKLKIDFSAMIDYNNVDNTDVNANRTIVVPKNIKHLHLVGASDVVNLEYQNLSLQISYRNKDDPLTIHLNNIAFTADGKNSKVYGSAIYSQNEAPVILDVEGNVSIKGVNEAIRTKNLQIVGNGELMLYGGEESPAIRCENNCSVLMEGGEVYIYGGNGKNGAYSGASGTDGMPGIIANSLNINADIKMEVHGGSGGSGFSGTDGKDASSYTGSGKAGTNGGNGGNGGAAVEIKEIELQCSSAFFYGGNGGIGGRGGNGGNGASKKGNGPTNLHDDPGNGGDSGSGGKGGDGGKTGLPFVLNNGSCGGSGGIGGQPGTPGKAGHFYWDPWIGDRQHWYGNQGTQGSKGKDGSSG